MNLHVRDLFGERPCPIPTVSPQTGFCQEAEAAQDEPMDQAEDACRYDKRQR